MIRGINKIDNDKIDNLKKMLKIWYQTIQNDSYLDTNN